MKKRFLLALLVGCELVGSSVEARELQGLMDVQGNFVLPAEYRSIRPLGDGNFAVTTFGTKDASDETTFVVDANGKQLPGVKPPIYKPNALFYMTAPNLDYEQVSSYDEKLGSLSGLRNKKTGRMSVPFQSRKLMLPFPVGDDLFIVEKEENGTPYMVLTRDGDEVVAKIPNLIVSPNYMYVEGLMLVENRERKHGFIDSNGRLVAARFFDVANNFSNHVAAVSFVENDTKYGAYINKEGAFVLGPTKNATYERFYDGIAGFSKFDGKASAIVKGLAPKPRWGALNAKLEVVVPAEYESVHEFGAYLVAKTPQEKGGRFVLFTRNGNKQCEFPKETTKVQPGGDDSIITYMIGGTPGSGGTIDGGKWGYMNLQGTTIIEPKFDSATPFSNGRAAVGLKDKTGKILVGLIDVNGKFIVEPNYKAMYPTKSLTLVVDEKGGVFDPYKWANMDSSQAFLNRREQWAAFLKEYDLIGMSREKVHELLGDDANLVRMRNTRGRGYSSISPEGSPSSGTGEAAKPPAEKRIFYGLNSGMCGYSSSSIELEFDDGGKVHAWRVQEGSGRNSDWFRENMIRVDRENTSSSLSAENLAVMRRWGYLPKYGMQ